MFSFSDIGLETSQVHSRAVKIFLQGMQKLSKFTALIRLS